MPPSPPEPPILVKIGGSTLGGNDTSLHDLAARHAAGRPVVIVHGGGNVISDWMRRQNLAPAFVNGLRVTDAPSLEIVVAVLAGLVNKELTAQLQNLGAPTIGISGVDGGLLQARIANPQLGYVGEIAAVNPAPVHAILAAGCIPLISPIAMNITPAGNGNDGDGNGDGVSDHAGRPINVNADGNGGSDHAGRPINVNADGDGGSDHAGRPLNVNGDTAAGALAAALRARQIIFLTDVPGVMDSGGRVIPRLNAAAAAALRDAGVARGGMLPKLDAAIAAIAGRPDASAHIIDGRQPGALAQCIAGRPVGTRITP